MRLQVCSQMWFDPILQQFARTFRHVRLRYRTRLEFIRRFRKRRERGDRRSRKRPARARAGRLSGCVRRREQHGAPRARHRARRARRSDIPCTCTFARRVCCRRAARKPTTFFVTIDRGGVWSNVRVIDPNSAMWRLMVLDSDGDADARDRGSGRPICAARLAARSRSSGSAPASGRGAARSRNAIRRAASSSPGTPCINCRRPVRSG